MYIPNSLLIIHHKAGTSSQKIQPAYVAKLYKALLGPRLEPERGVEICELADFASDQERYRQIDSVEAEERAWISYFSTQATSGQTNVVGGSSVGTVAEIFHRAFPDGLRGEIEALIRKDAVSQADRAKRAKKLATPHPSFIKLGLSADECLMFQARGVATADEIIPGDVVQVAEAGFTPARAAEILAAVAKLTTTLPKQTSPVAA